ncbi:aggregation-promoting factor C-terminal-like domain-containing protein [Levilactobacillus mulengensis]|uniref:aggregation-promoting factor C-terminal-like domain-containing protein n=1 Tax=Levilactobacillus mulengensis TaxID=2486025 RepID=UPI000F7B4757|nr:transglycosylase [Levilactobacillus mulengensis]
MTKFKIKLASILLIFGFSFGMIANVATSFTSEPSVTAEAATLSANQKKQIAQINSGLSKKQKAAKNWIAFRESRFSYRARNGNCYGRYQLLKSYLHGDLSAVNQEKTANKYVAGRYGSWTKAKSFWQHHHWY